MLPGEFGLKPGMNITNSNGIFEKSNMEGRVSGGAIFPGLDNTWGRGEGRKFYIGI